ncbi:response regulator [Chenggangzhangella methanolivorans]|uniref:Response regulator n=1 Tax=Chenggangzhangella methanolivorans TaxID=1437009 RepID=A0A9E6RDU7_9HYPH|nr:response regulator [Chenggangzhangella methanolivorans]QZO02100.1 response regulator [Chenggangzhangella methanolivorans]
MSSHVALIAEDDAITLMAAAATFQDAGYEVLEAGDAHEAWDILSGRDNVILLLTDIEMPGTMNGLELANKVHRSWPHIEIIVCSGRVKPVDGELPEPVMFLGKPVDLMTLQQKARETVEAKANTRLLAEGFAGKDRAVSGPDDFEEAQSPT